MLVLKLNKKLNNIFLNNYQGH